MIGISDLEYLCAEVRQIARKAGAFLRDERQKFDRERVEEKSAHNYVSVSYTHLTLPTILLV